MIRVGIDPGISGAIVVLEDDQPIEWFSMPTMMVGKANRVNPFDLSSRLEYLLRGRDEVTVYIENVGAMPGQGVTSMFSFGHSAGVAFGVAGALGHPVKFIAPGVWKKRASLTGSDKDAARSAAILRWPGWQVLSQKGRGQAYADAALLAVYGD
jgi:crossover junction endodeoxyribonuclease RuvC